MSPLTKRLAALPVADLHGMLRGVEKESLRSTLDGALALTPHPAALGCALTHPHITTDFSESQLELITGVHPHAQSCIDELTQVHQVVYRTLGEEMLWVASMPCGLPIAENIPIGRYGWSNVGRAKSIYRMGLGHRYGRRMQTISGIHYNWSMPGIDDAGYFSLIRNFRRHAFLLLYLFGASPAVCSSFVADREHGLQPLAGQTLHLPYATSLRMGRLGYQSEAQATLAVSYNNLESYAASLEEAMLRPYPAYEAIGVQGPGGDYNQLGTSLLQIENEFYGTIRPKRAILPGERPLHALRERGVQYVEVRCLDLNPFDPVGISTDTLRFLDVFLLHCLLTDSALDTPAEIAELSANQHRVAMQGRDPGLQLVRAGQAVSLRNWGLDVLKECAVIAERLDALTGMPGHQQAVADAQAAMDQPEQLPSARVLAEMAHEHDNAFVRFARARSLQTRHVLSELSLDQDTQQRFAALAIASVDAQAAIEAADTLSFEEYRQQYLSPESLRAQRLQPAMAA